MSTQPRHRSRPPPPARKRGVPFGVAAWWHWFCWAWSVLRPAHDDQGRDRGPGGRPNVIVTVGQATVRKAELPVIIDALGTVIPATTVTLRPQVSGLLTQVLFTEGQMVSKGQ